MGLRVLRGGRRQIGNVQTYVGEFGTVFYDETTGRLRLSDDVTPGGLPLFTPAVSFVQNTEPTETIEGTFWYKPSTFELSVYHDGDFRPTINLATESKIGGVKLGPGVITNSEGQIIIDSTGLDFSFGDFTAITGSYSDSTAYAQLSIINPDEDIVIASNGDGDIKVVGGFEVYATNGSVTGSLEEEPFFRILEDGQVRILVPLADTTEGGLEVIGSELGTSLAPGLAGVMLHLTGNEGLPTRVYHDTLDNYGSYVFRRYNGSVISPTQVLANEDIARFNWTAATDAGMGNVATAQIRVTALENQTTTAQGSKITFTVTPVGSAATSRVDVADITVANGVSATKFTGPVLQNGTSNVTVNNNGNVNISVGGNVLTVTSTGANIAGTANISGNANIGNVGTGTIIATTANLTTINSGLMQNGTSNVTVNNNGNVNVSVAGNANILTVTGSGIVVNGSLSTNDGISDGIGNVRSVPLNSQTGAYQLAATDNGKMISITTGGVTVPASVFTSPYGQIVSIYNDSNSSQTITQGASVTLRLAGTAATGNRTLARYGVATITCVAANTFVISGAGLT